MIIAATGHRPEKLGGHSDNVNVRLQWAALKYLADMAPDGVISGMALGWDMAFAEAALSMGIPVNAAIPFVGQERMWPGESQQRYRNIIAQCAEVKIVCSGGYSAHKMHDRNRWMVDNADRVCALWNGGKSGGTWNCMRYAMMRARPIDNIWSSYHV